MSDSKELNYEVALVNITGALKELTEAVRALKPAPFAQPIEKVYVAALEENAALRVEVNRQLAEAVRLRNELKWREGKVVSEHEEVERLRAENAEQTRAIEEYSAEVCSLDSQLSELRISNDERVELQRLRTENAGHVKKIERLRVRIDAMKENWAREREATEEQRQNADKLRATVAEAQIDGAMAELQRFREREPDVQKVASYALDMLKTLYKRGKGFDSYGEAEAASAAIAAVRDFKVTP